MAKRVLVECRDLFFRGKLQEVVRTGGGEPVREEPFELAVIELGRADGSARIIDLVARGIPVLAFACGRRGAPRRAGPGRARSAELRSGERPARAVVDSRRATRS